MSNVSDLNQRLYLNHHISGGGSWSATSQSLPVDVCLVSDWTDSCILRDRNIISVRNSSFCLSANVVGNLTKLINMTAEGNKTYVSPSEEYFKWVWLWNKKMNKQQFQKRISLHIHLQSMLCILGCCSWDWFLIVKLHPAGTMCYIYQKESSIRETSAGLWRAVYSWPGS